MLAGCKASRCRPARCGGAGRATRVCWRCPARVPAPAPSATAPAWPPAPPTASPGCCCSPPSSCTQPTSSSSSPGDGEETRRHQNIFQDTLMETMQCQHRQLLREEIEMDLLLLSANTSPSTPTLPPSPRIFAFQNIGPHPPTVMTPVDIRHYSHYSRGSCVNDANCVPDH